MKTKVDKVDAFKTTDGQLFTEESDAIRAQQKINLRARIVDILDMDYCRDMDVEEVAEILVKNIDRLKEILE